MDIREAVKVKVRHTSYGFGVINKGKYSTVLWSDRSGRGEYTR